MLRSLVEDDHRRVREAARDVGQYAVRASLPVRKDGRQVGYASTSTWSPVLKKYIALVHLQRPHYEPGTRVELRISTDKPVRTEWLTQNTVRVTFELSAEAWGLLERALEGTRHCSTDPITDASMFYAQSWLFVHYMTLGNGGKRGCRGPDAVTMRNAQGRTWFVIAGEHKKGEGYVEFDAVLK